MRGGGELFNPRMEAMGTAELHALHERKLRRQLAYVLRHSPFYQEKFRAAGLSLTKRLGLNDLPLIPFTTKEEIRLSQEQAPPLGRHMACPWERVVRVYSTSGTSGRPCFVGLTAHDLDVFSEIGARSYYAAGIRPGSRAVSMGGGGPFISAVGHHALDRIRPTLIAVGRGNTDRVVSAFRFLKGEILICSPSYIGHLSDWCRQRGIDPANLGVRRFVVAGEPGGGMPAVRRHVEQTFGAQVRERMGIADLSIGLWGECEAQGGMHFCGQGYVHVELIDPASGQNLAWGDGVEGELVYTALDRQCVPLLRYRSRDHVRVWTSPCSCGRTGHRLRCFGRTDDMLMIRGVNVYPSAVRDVVSSLSPRTTGELQIVLDQPGSRVDPPLRIRVEQGAGVSEPAGLNGEIERLLRERLVFQAVVELVPAGSLPRSEQKSRLVVKAYEHQGGRASDRSPRAD